MKNYDNTSSDLETGEQDVSLGIQKDFEIQKIFQLLNIDNWKAANLNNLEEILNGLTYGQGMDVIIDVLQIEDFWLTQNDYINRRNSRNQSRYFDMIPSLLVTDRPMEYSAPEQRLFGEELSNLLSNYCGIVYDKHTRTLSVGKTQTIHQIPKTINARLLVNVDFEDYFLKSICQELNGVHRAGFYNSTLLLVRKLLENLLIKLLEFKFPKNIDGNLEMYYDVSRERYKDFNDLIKVVRKKKKEFADGHSTIQRFLTKVEKLTDITNPTAHKLTYNASQDDVHSLEVQELLELFKKICDSISLDKIFRN